MKELSGRIAVVTGGGSGMGRELVRLLVAEGCHVAMCDVSMQGMAETRRQCEATGLPQGPPPVRRDVRTAWPPPGSAPAAAACRPLR